MKLKDGTYRDLINSFLAFQGAYEICNGAELKETGYVMGHTIRLQIQETGRNELTVTIENNSNNGFTEFKKCYAFRNGNLIEKP